MAYKPKILLFDIETHPALGHYYDNSQPYSVFNEVEPMTMLSFSYKWLGEKKIHTTCLPDFDSYTPGSKDDYFLVGELHKLLKEADHYMGHNCDSFDLRFTNGRLIFHGYDPYPQKKSIDTLKVHRRIAKTGSNRLDALAKYYGFGKKVVHSGKEMFLGCGRGEEWAWKEIREYNPHDVWLLEQLYYKIRPWIPNHPNLNLLVGKPRACRACLGEDFILNGTKNLRGGWKQRYQCKACGAHNYSTEKYPYETKIKME